MHVAWPPAGKKRHKFDKARAVNSTAGKSWFTSAAEAAEAPAAAATAATDTAGAAPASSVAAGERPPSFRILHFNDV